MTCKHVKNLPSIFGADNQVIPFSRIKPSILPIPQKHWQ